MILVLLVGSDVPWTNYGSFADLPAPEEYDRDPTPTHPIPRHTGGPELGPQLRLCMHVINLPWE